jgi:SAM-dependent methyltransferase
MATEQEIQARSGGEDELGGLRRRLDALERSHAEQIARANAAIAAAQDKSYWLERWHVDLNELMRRRGASETRAAVRALRAVYRRMYDLRYRTRDQVRALPLRVHDARRAVQEERRVAQAAEGDPFARTISPEPPIATPVTDVLYERLDPATVSEVEAQLTPAEQGHWDAAPSGARRRLALAYGVHHGVPEVLNRTGLRSAAPPEEIHAMERGSASAGGSTYSADMVVEAARETGFELGPGKTGLDFGCSSGRVVRVLAAAYPEMEWHGCDPLDAATDWARENLPGISFVHSPERPPLTYSDGSMDLVFAISIWSHFGETAALGWLAEMRRVVRPGGRLVLTTHGPHSIAYASAHGLRQPAQLEEIERALYRDGFWFVDEFGSEGDFGLRDAQWGTAFFSPEWLLGRTGDGWRIGAFHPGRLQDNQDLYVLEPR